MLKLVGRYVVAALMIPIGVVLGVCGVVQNYLRRKRYERRAREIAAQVARENQAEHDTP